MMTVRAARAGASVLFFAWLACGTLVTAVNDDLAHAKELYFSAAYDEALAALDGLTISGSSPEAIEVSEYRMFCLLALDRRKEAEEAIELIIEVNPFYLPSATQVSPRIVAVFQDVRRSLLPVVLPRFYADAKAAYDRKDPHAAAQFDRVLALLAELDVSSSPALADLHAATAGFRDLSKADAALVATPAAAPSTAPTVPRSSSASPTATPIGGDMTGPVRAVLREFQRAYTDLNVGVAKSVWPSVDEKTLGRAFDQLEQQDLVFDGCQIEVTGIRAVATCDGQSRYVPKVGSKTARLASGRWTFDLEQAQGEWMITTVKLQ